jgi:hypothetical protein
MLLLDIVKEYAPERIVRLREVMGQLDTELEKVIV